MSAAPPPPVIPDRRSASWPNGSQPWFATESVLELRRVHASYGRIEVLHGVDLTIRAGQCVALLGANGAGKTSLLKVATGLLAATSGCVHLAGRHVNGVTPDDLARVGICTVPEGRGVFPNLTVAENLKMATYTGMALEAIESDAYARFPKLAQRRDQLAGTMSGGEQQMLALARALATRPALLLVDELSMGLAPLIVDQLFTEVARIVSEGVAVLVIEQFARKALQVAEWGVLLSQGVVQAEGTPDQLGEALDRAYLGTKRG